MRIASLVLLGSMTLTAAFVAQAADWPAGGKDNYLKECVAAGTTQAGADAGTAKKHCECTAQALEKQLTTDELTQLSNQTASEELHARAVKLMQTGCPAPTPAKK